MSGTKAEPCRRCGGSGVDSFYSPTRRAWQPRVCPICDGTGAPKMMVGRHPIDPRTATVCPFDEDQEEPRAR